MSVKFSSFLYSTSLTFDIMVHNMASNIEWGQKIIGLLFLFLSLYGVFATYRVLRYKELRWDYPFINRSLEKTYPKAVYTFVGLFSIPILVFFFFLAARLLIP